MQENYRIQACLFKIGGVNIGHCFLRLVDFWGNVVEELHGLATSKDDQIKAVGSLGDSLKAYCFMGPYLEAHVTNVVREGSGTFECWQTAKTCIEKINESDIPYPIFGLFRFGPLYNSNSVFSTFLKTMNLPIPDFKGFFTPGKENIILAVMPDEQPKEEKTGRINNNFSG